MSQTMLILEDEPLSNALVKWSAWMATMVVFVMVLIYFSNYFAHMDECFIAGEYDSGNTLQDLKNKKWKARFVKTEPKSYV